MGEKYFFNHREILDLMREVNHQVELLTEYPTAPNQSDRNIPGQRVMQRKNIRGYAVPMSAMEQPILGGNLLTGGYTLYVSSTDLKRVEVAAFQYALFRSQVYHVKIQDEVIHINTPFLLVLSLERANNLRPEINSDPLLALPLKARLLPVPVPRDNSTPFLTSPGISDRAPELSLGAIAPTVPVDPVIPEPPSLDELPDPDTQEPVKYSVNIGLIPEIDLDPEQTVVIDTQYSITDGQSVMDLWLED